MPNFNNVTIVGHVGRDPELRYTQNGTPVLDTSVAVNRFRKVGETMEQETAWVPVTVWGKSAENFNTYVKKGNPILIHGYLTEDKWTTQAGEKRSRLKVTCEQMVLLGQKQSDRAPPTGEYTSPPQAVRQPESTPAADGPLPSGVPLLDGGIDIPF